MASKARATIEDLYGIPENGKAEIVDGEIVRIMPTGGLPGRVTHSETPTVYRLGDIADAEPAVPAWRVPVDEFFQ
jgi:hypothetical protein